jgi:hypothetical protein
MANQCDVTVNYLFPVISNGILCLSIEIKEFLEVHIADNVVLPILADQYLGENESAQFVQQFLRYGGLHVKSKDMPALDHQTVHTPFPQFQ